MRQRRIIINRIPRFEEWKLVKEYLEKHPDDVDAIEIKAAFENKFHVDTEIIRVVFRRIAKTI